MEAITVPTPEPAPAAPRAPRAWPAVALGSALLGACWLPLGAAPFLPLGAAVALRGLRRCRSGRQALRLGLVFGAARYAVASHFLLALWTHSPLAVAFYALAVASVLPFSLLEVGLAWKMRERAAVPLAAGMALLYPLSEWARTLGPLSMPADLLAHALGTHPAWLSWAAAAGPFSVPLLVFACGGLLEAGWERARTAPLKASGLASAGILLWAAPLATSLLLPPPPPGPWFTMALVQPAATVAEKVEPSRRPALWLRLEQLTLLAAESRPDLVVWPETARPGAVKWRDGEDGDPRVQALADRIGLPILYGADLLRAEGGRERLHNGAVLVRPGAAGRPPPWYGKQRLLPFAEAVPFAGAVGWDPLARRGERGSALSMVGRFSPGPGPVVFEAGPARIGVLICYEGLYPDLADAYRRAGANLLLVLTNDAWWGRSVFPEWHARAVAARARETGLPVVRAANSGISSLTDATGERRRASSLGEVTVLRVAAPLGSGRPGPRRARLADAVVPALAAMVLAALLLPPPVRRRG